MKLFKKFYPLTTTIIILIINIFIVWLDRICGPTTASFFDHYLFIIMIECLLIVCIRCLRFIYIALKEELQSIFSKED